MREIKVGLIGFGTVGQGVVKILLEGRDIIASKLGAHLVLKGIADLNLERDRGIPLEGIRLTTDAKELITDPDIDIIVELIGGEEPAKSYILEATERGKSVVTANKLLLARWGREILEAARRRGVQIAFEASVGGGIPIVRSLRDGLVADRIRAVFGIINGTSNYILTEMTERGGRFSEVLKVAQEKGYAEADPTLDVEGHDSAHKLTILILLAFGKHIEADKIYTEGISHITPLDIEFAQELGYRIKLLAIAKREGEFIEARVHPTMVPADSLLATVGGVYNAIFVKGEATGSTMFYGRGAGMMPAGAAVVADLVEIARNIMTGGSAPMPVHDEGLALRDMSETVNHYYFRFSAIDRPGVLSKISGVLGDHDISIASMIQKGRQVKGAVPVVMMTHEAKEKNVLDALRIIDQLAVVRGKTMMIRVEESLS